MYKATHTENHFQAEISLLGPTLGTALLGCSMFTVASLGGESSIFSIFRFNEKICKMIQCRPKGEQGMIVRYGSKEESGDGRQELS
jgi:hypothetical protein